MYTRHVCDNPNGRTGSIGVSGNIDRSTKRGQTLKTAEALRMQLNNMLNNTPGINQKIDIDREQYEEFRVNLGL